MTLGAEIGVLAVLHSWGQRLEFHPHLHCIVTGGGLSLDGTRWVHCKRSKSRKKAFLIPVKILSRVFRGKFIDLLKRVYRKGRLSFHGTIAGLANAVCFEHCLKLAVRNDWVVFAKRPFGSASCVLKYLARYTHRVAISNRRLKAMQNGRVHFEFKDYADEMKRKPTSLTPLEFIRRFLTHVVPNGFVRIRHYGFLANRHRHEKLAKCRKLLGVLVQQQDDHERDNKEGDWSPTDDSHFRVCPSCKEGVMIIIEMIYAGYVHLAPVEIPVRMRSPPVGLE